MALDALFDTLADLLFPPRCTYCRRLGSTFCRTCQATANFIGDSICVHCGTPTTERCVCVNCQRSFHASPLRGMRGAVFYRGPVTFAIHGLKYRGITRLARPLSAYLIAYLASHPIAFDCLVPVPLHPERQAGRGYNQSELLAIQVGKVRKLPVRTDLITRVRHTLPQVHLNRRQRQENVRDAFAPIQNGSLHGETVLLIDDVCTTGATLLACASALRAAGAGVVWALTIARAYPKTNPEPWRKGLDPTGAFLAWDGLPPSKTVMPTP